MWSLETVLPSPSLSSGRHVKSVPRETDFSFMALSGHVSLPSQRGLYQHLTQKQGINPLLPENIS